MAVELGSGQLDPRLRETSWKARRSATSARSTSPSPKLWREEPGRQAGDLRRHRQGGEHAQGSRRSTTNSPRRLGLEGLEKLRGLFKGQIEQELNGLTRTHMKRKLLDQLAAGHDFPVPPSMVDAEFAQIWRQLEHEATHEADPAAAMAEMEKERDDYRAIAERRVRLGLLLSEIGQQNGIEVTQKEMQRLAAQAAQQYDPKDRQRFLEYIQQDPIAAAQLRAPLYEDKVVDFLFGKADVSDRAK
jgi:trigger factor